MGILGICTDYRSTRDCFSYIAAFAPKFEGSRKVTLDEIFADLLNGISIVSAMAKTSESVENFEEARRRAVDAKALYEKGDRTQASHSIRDAERAFELGYKRRGKAAG